MEEEKKLYPLGFCTLEDTYSWGSEEFRLADLGYRDSLVRSGWLAANSLGEVMDMYMDRVVGEGVYRYWGRQFPVAVRVLNVKGTMPLRVHPDGETAGQRYDLLGKEKLWYVLRAGKDARLMLGFRKDTDASELYTKCLDNSVEDILNVVAAHSGQCFHIVPGTPHAAAGDMTILEIAESSPLDFCMCGWGKEVSTEEFDESLSLIDALDFINYGRYKADMPSGSTLADIPEFRVEKMEVKDVLKVRSQEDAFVVYVCTEGEAAVQIHVLDQTVSYPLKKTEAILVPAECDEFFIAPLQKDTTILEVTVPAHLEQDAYINPDAEPTLDDGSEEKENIF